MGVSQHNLGSAQTIRRTTPHRLFPLTFLAAALSTGSVFAQETAAQSDGNVLPEVQVRAAGEKADGPAHSIVAKRSATWTKTDTPLLGTPQAVTVITKEQMEDQGAQGLDEAVRYSAGVVGGNYGFDARTDWLTVRGFSPARFLDGMAMPNGVWTGVTRIETYGLERIDILKGPSSVLYGQMPPGGMVNMVSKRPSPEKSGEAGMSFGSHGEAEGFFDMTGPLDPEGVWSYRLTGLARQGDSTVDYVDDERSFLAPALTWQPDENTSLTLLARVQYADTATTSGFLPAQGTLLSNPYGKIPRSRFIGEPDYDYYKKHMASAGYIFEHRFNDVWAFRQNLRYADTRVDHRTVSGNGLEDDLRTLDRFVYTPYEKSKMFTVDNQLQADFKTGTVTHTVLIGLEYGDGKNDYSWGYSDGPPLDIFNPVYGSLVVTPPDSSHTIQKQRQTGVYLQDQIQWNNWVLTLSGRQDWVRTKTDNVLAGTKTNQDDDEFSGRVGLNYVFDNGIAPYIAYSQSFQPTLGTDYGGNPFKPTTGEQVELGVKYQPKGSRSLLTIAAYDITQKNVLTVDPVHAFNSVQQGKIEIRGVEIEGKFVPMPGLNLIASYAYTDSEVKESTDPLALGKQVALVPKNQASLWADYTFLQGPLSGFGLGGGVRYVGETYGDAYNEWQASSYTLFDAVIHYDLGPWRFQLNGNNLADKRYVAACNGAAWCYYGNPRTVTFTAKYMW